MSDTAKILKDNIKTIIAHYGGAARMARLTNIPKSSMADYYHGKSLPSKENLTKILKFAHISYDDWMYGKIDFEQVKDKEVLMKKYADFGLIDSMLPMIRSENSEAFALCKMADYLASFTNNDYSAIEEEMDEDLNSLKEIIENRKLLLQQKMEEIERSGVPAEKRIQKTITDDRKDAIKYYEDAEKDYNDVIVKWKNARSKEKDASDILERHDEIPKFTWLDRVYAKKLYAETIPIFIATMKANTLRIRILDTYRDTLNLETGECEPLSKSECNELIEDAKDIAKDNQLEEISCFYEAVLGYILNLETVGITRNDSLEMLKGLCRNGNKYAECFCVKRYERDGETGGNSKNKDK